jgi:hypothetical protein
MTGAGGIIGERLCWEGGARVKPGRSVKSRRAGLSSGPFYENKVLKIFALLGAAPQPGLFDTHGNLRICTVNDVDISLSS